MVSQVSSLVYDVDFQIQDPLEGQDVDWLN